MSRYDARAWPEDQANALRYGAALQHELAQIDFAFRRAACVVDAGCRARELRNLVDTAQRINGAVQLGRRN